MRELRDRIARRVAVLRSRPRGTWPLMARHRNACRREVRELLEALARKRQPGAHWLTLARWLREAGEKPAARKALAYARDCRLIELEVAKTTARAAAAWERARRLYA